MPDRDWMDRHFNVPPKQRPSITEAPPRRAWPKVLLGLVLGTGGVAFWWWAIHPESKLAWPTAAVGVKQGWYAKPREPDPDQQNASVATPPDVAEPTPTVAGSPPAPQAPMISRDQITSLRAGIAIADNEIAKADRSLASARAMVDAAADPNGAMAIARARSVDPNGQTRAFYAFHLRNMEAELSNAQQVLADEGRNRGNWVRRRGDLIAKLPPSEREQYEKRETTRPVQQGKSRPALVAVAAATAVPVRVVPGLDPRISAALSGVLDWRTVQLIAADGTLLGNLNPMTVDLDSINCPVGDHGSVVGEHSIYCRVGRYGGEVGEFSPFSRVCFQPPTLYVAGEAVCVVTVCEAVPGPRLDPQMLKALPKLFGW